MTGLGIVWAVHTFGHEQKVRHDDEQADRVSQARMVAVASSASSTEDSPPNKSTDMSAPNSWTTRFQWTVMNAGRFPIFRLVVSLPQLCISSGDPNGKYEEFPMGDLLPGGYAAGGASQITAKRASIDGFGVVEFTFTDVYGVQWSGTGHEPVVRISPDRLGTAGADQCENTNVDEESEAIGDDSGESQRR